MNDQGMEGETSKTSWEVHPVEKLHTDSELSATRSTYLSMPYLKSFLKRTCVFLTPEGQEKAAAMAMFSSVCAIESFALLASAARSSRL